MKKIPIISIIIVIVVLIGVVIFINLNTDNLNTDNIVCDITNPTLCKTDQECICIEHDGCFMGNKNYYEKCEDKTFACLDFCHGWGQKPVKCINNKCENIY
ncbi:hypothetical protein ACFLQN_02745 [Candidatus Aenigmatarchaeota archaeon]